MDDRNLKINIREREPRDLHEAYVAAERYESYMTASESSDCSNDKYTFNNRRIQTERNSRETAEGILRQRLEQLESEQACTPRSPSS